MLRILLVYRGKWEGGNSDSEKQDYTSSKPADLPKWLETTCFVLCVLGLFCLLGWRFVLCCLKSSFWSKKRERCILSRNIMDRWGWAITCGCKTTFSAKLGNFLYQNRTDFHEYGICIVTTANLKIQIKQVWLFLCVLPFILEDA